MRCLHPQLLEKVLIAHVLSRAIDPPTPRKLIEAGKRQIEPNLLREYQTIGASILARKNQPAANRFERLRTRISFPAQRHFTRHAFTPRPKKMHQQFRPARTHQPTDSQYLTCRYMKRDIR